MEERRAEGLAFVAGRWPLDRGRPTLLFIHGAAGSSAHWNVQLDDLLDVANTLAVDLPGHGRTPGPAPDRVEAYAGRLPPLVRALGGGRVVPVGFSMGGAIVLQALLDEPALFAGGVLVATGARLRVMPAIFETIERDFQEYVRMKGRVAASARTDPALLRPVLEDTARCDPQVALGDFRACDAFDVRDRLPAIEKPVLVISAEEDVLTPPKFADYLVENLPCASRVHLDAAGHLVSVERAVEVGDAIRGFLRELAAGA